MIKKPHYLIGMETFKHCRICLKIQPDIYSIFERRKWGYLPTVIYNISGVKISPSREPRAQICLNCASAVVIAEKIILRCQSSDEYIGKQNEHLKQSQQKRKNKRYHSSVDLCCNKVIGMDHLKEVNAVGNSKVYNQGDAMGDALNSEDEGSTVFPNFNNSANKMISKPVPSTRRTKISLKTRFDCDLCDFTTITGKRFVAHKRDKHQIDDPNIYVCKLCPRRFYWKPTLYRHIQSDHNTIPEEKKYICDVCGKAYTREIHLIEHKKQRHEPRRFRCADPDCQQTFTRAFTLRRHFLAAHGNKTRYHCADCNKYFKIYDLWNYHNEVIHKNTTVCCPRCGYPFRFKHKLREHLKKNVCIRSTIPCPSCQRKFTTKSGLREHLKKIHNVTDYYC